MRSYESPKVELIEFEDKDIIVTSGEQCYSYEKWTLEHVAGVQCTKQSMGTATNDEI